MHLKFMFDYGEIYTCIWNDEPTDEYYGCPMHLDELPLSDGLRADIVQMCEEFQSSLDWEYPPDPSPWTQEHMQDFMARSKAAYNRVVAELGDAYTVEYLPETFSSGQY